VQELAQPGSRPEGENAARPTRASMVAAAARVGQLVAFAVLPVALVTAFLGLAIGNKFAFDFRQFWQGARDVVRGDSPYPSLESVEAIADLQALGPEAVQEVFRFPYPAPVAVVLAPLGALPFELAAGIFTAALLVAVVLTLRLLGVRDWRCYGAAFASVATLGAVRLGTLTPLLALGLAVAWRYRDRRWIAVPAVGAVVLAKLFLWPVLVWLLATRRTGTAALALASAAGATVLGWAAIGFAGFRDYPQLVAKLGQAVDEKGYSLVALAAALDLPRAVGRAALAVVAVAGVAAVVAAARRADGDRRSLTLAIGVAVVASPIVWLHYFALLLVPIALARPRLGALWLLPLAFWVTPFQETDGHAWRIVAGLAVFALALALALRHERRRELVPAVSRA
jgi:alpha-1,2-mannosyltransferase